MARRPTAHDGSRLERRKTLRFTVTIPLEASWRGPDGIAVKEEAVAKQVNATGGLIEMVHYPEAGSRITLTNFLSAENAEARVLATPNSRDGVWQSVVVELVVPDESFWGISLQVKKTSIELQRLEKALRSGGIDLRVLKEFRDAVDHLQTLAASVQLLRERQVQGEDDVAPSAMVNERIRRTTNLCLEVITDLDASRVNERNKGVNELLDSVQQIQQRLKTLLRRDSPVFDRS